MVIKDLFNIDGVIDIKFLIGCVVVGLVSCYFWYYLSRLLFRFGRRGVDDEYKMLKL